LALFCGACTSAAPYFSGGEDTVNDPERELVDDQVTIAYRDDYGISP
jgi:hypothetical protein